MYTARRTLFSRINDLGPLAQAWWASPQGDSVRDDVSHEVRAKLHCQLRLRGPLGKVNLQTADSTHLPPGLARLTLGQFALAPAR